MPKRKFITQSTDFSRNISRSGRPSFITSTGGSTFFRSTAAAFISKNLKHSDHGAIIQKTTEEKEYQRMVLIYERTLQDFNAAFGEIVVGRLRQSGGWELGQKPSLEKVLAFLRQSGISIEKMVRSVKRNRSKISGKLTEKATFESLLEKGTKSRENLTKDGWDTLQEVVKIISQEPFWSELMHKVKIVFITDISPGNSKIASVKPPEQPEKEKIYALHINYGYLNSRNIKSLKRALVHELSHISLLKFPGFVESFHPLIDEIATVLMEELAALQIRKNGHDPTTLKKADKKLISDYLKRHFYYEKGAIAFHEIFAEAQALTHASPNAITDIYVRMENFAKRLLQLPIHKGEIKRLLNSLAKWVEIFYELRIWKLPEDPELRGNYRRMQKTAVRYILSVGKNFS